MQNSIIVTYRRETDSYVIYMYDPNKKLYYYYSDDDSMIWVDEVLVSARDVKLSVTLPEYPYVTFELLNTYFNICAKPTLENITTLIDTSIEDVKSASKRMNRSKLEQLKKQEINDLLLEMKILIEELGIENASVPLLMMDKNKLLYEKSKWTTYVTIGITNASLYEWIIAAKKILPGDRFEFQAKMEKVTHTVPLAIKNKYIPHKTLVIELLGKFGVDTTNLVIDSIFASMNIADLMSYS